MSEERRGYMPVANTTDWATPKELFGQLWEEFGPFDLDPCGAREHHYSAWRIENQGGRFMDGSTEAMDGLAQPWFGIVYMNPPYGKEAPPWIEKAVAEVVCGNASRVVALLPARTDTRIWQKHILREAAYDRIAAPDYVRLVRFLPGRLKFGGQSGPAPFPSCVVVWERDGGSAGD